MPKKFGRFINLFDLPYSIIKLFLMELNYQVHLRIRYLHDLAYKNNTTYRRYSDSPVSKIAHKTVVWGFLASFTFFTVAQYVLPEIFNFGKPGSVQAATNTYSWPTNASFNTATTNDKVSLGSTISLKNGDFGTGAQGNVTIASGQTVNIKTLITGYNGTTIIPNFNNLTVDGTLTVDPEVPLYFKVKNTFTISSTGKIDADGKGFASGPGTSPSFYGSGGYGGAGGQTYARDDWGAGAGHDAPGPIYGAYPATINFGSGAWGGRGGGLIKIECSQMSISGTVTANGQYTASVGNSGGGIHVISGSQVDLTKFYIRGSEGAYFNHSDGIEYADSVWGGGGGGGRIFASAPSFISAPADNIRGGYSAGNGSTNGGAGAVTTLPGFQTPGTVGSTTAGAVGLRFDAELVNGIGSKVDPTSIAANLTTANTGQKIMYKIRVGNTQAELNTSSCYGPTGVEASPCSDWSTDASGNYFYQKNVSGTITSNPATYPTNLNTSIPAKRFVEFIFRLESDGSNTPIVNSLTLTYDSLESPSNSNLTLKKSDNTTLLRKNDGTDATVGTPGGYTNETALKVSATNLTCTGCSSSTNRRIEVEAKPITTAFNETGLIQGDSTDAGGGNVTSVANLTGLSDATNYHIRVRTIDNEGRVSAWTSYGGNSDGVTDFSIEQATPTISNFQVNMGGAYVNSATRLLSVNGVFNDTGGSSGALEIQYSEDGVNWGVTNAFNNGNNTSTDWTYKSTITASAGFQTLVNSSKKTWYLTGEGAKNIYVRTRDAAGNVSGKVFTTKAEWESTTRTNIDSITANGSIQLNSTGVSPNYGNGVIAGTTIIAAGTTKNIKEFISNYNGTTVVPEFENLTIDGTLTVDPLVPLNIRVKNQLVVNGNIDADGKGYSGGAGGIYDDWDGGQPGGNGSGPGGGVGGGVSFASGKGLPGGPGVYNTSSFFEYGSGGGGGGSDNYTNSDGNGGSGGNGGGKIIVNANNIQIAGELRAKGTQGGSCYYYNGCGGGGSGGSVVIFSNNGSINLSTISVSGGAGGSSSYVPGASGSGGAVSLSVNSTLLSGSPVLGTGDGTNSAIYKTSLAPYLTSGTLGSVSTGLRFGDAASSVKYKWSGLRWSGRNFSSTYKVKVQVRPGDTFGSGDTGYVNPVTGDNTWYEITSNNSRITLNSALANTKTLEIRLELIGDGSNTPILDDLSVEAASFDDIIGDFTQPTYSGSLSYSNGSNFVKQGQTQTITVNFTEDLSSTTKISIDYAGTGSDIANANMTQGANALTWYYNAVIPTGNSGNATVSFTGSDVAGNSLSGTPSTNIFKVDNTPPNVSMGTLGQYIKDQSIPLSFTSNDEFSTIIQTNNGLGAQAYDCRWEEEIEIIAINPLASRIRITAPVFNGEFNFPINSWVDVGSATKVYWYGWCDDIYNVTVEQSGFQTLSGVKNTKLYYTRNTSSPYTWTAYPNNGTPTTFTITPVTFDVNLISDITKNGNYGFKLVAEDNVGNISAIPNSTTAPERTTYIDTELPGGIININNSAVATSTLENLPYTFNLSDNFSGLSKYRIHNGNSWSGYTNVTGSSVSGNGVVTFENVEQGLKTVKIEVTDNAGNVAEISDSIAYDNIAPSAIHNVVAKNGNDILSTSGSTQGWYPHSTLSFVVKADDLQSGIKEFKYCIIKSGETCDYEANLPITAARVDQTDTYQATINVTLADDRQGVLTFKTKGFDHVGLSSAETTYTYKFDKILPSAVAGLNASKGDLVNPYRILISWDMPISNFEKAPIEKYKIERVKAAEYLQHPIYNDNWSTVNQFTSYSYITCSTSGSKDCFNPSNSLVGNLTFNSGRYEFEDFGMESSTKYIYRISAKDYSNESFGNLPANDPEFEIYGFTKDGNAPVLPIGGLQVQAYACDGASHCSAPNMKGKEIEVSWLPATDLGSGIDYYEIWRRDSTALDPENWSMIKTFDETEESNLDTSRRYIYDNTVIDAKRYAYRIVAVDAALPLPANHTKLAPGDDFTNVDNATQFAVLVPDISAPNIENLSFNVSANGIDTSLDTNASIVLHSGTATSAGVNSLVDTSKNWQTGLLKGLYIKITGGINNGETRLITNNNQNSITVNEDWSTTPDTSSEYEIYQGYQKISATWKQVSDNTTTTTISYKLFVSTSSDPSTFSVVGEEKTSSSFEQAHEEDERLSFNVAQTGLGDKTTFYYYLEIRDEFDNKATTTPYKPATTGNSQAPTPPSSIEVLNNDQSLTNGGEQLLVKYRGSLAKNCNEATKADCIVLYEAFQTETNITPDIDGGLTDNNAGDDCNLNETADDCWIRINSATLVNTQVPTTPVGDETLAAKRTFVAENLNEATKYFFRIRAIDNNTDAPLKGSLSSIGDGIHIGWDITKDMTAPELPAGGLEVKVKDTHPNTTVRRNIISWKILDKAPLRKKMDYEPLYNQSTNPNDCKLVQENGIDYCNDFGRYEIYRQILDGQNNVISDSEAPIASITDPNINFYIDALDINATLGGGGYLIDAKIRYYVRVVDNSLEAFKYQNGTNINNLPNMTAKEFSADTIIPSKAKPSLIGSVGVAEVSVASAKITWNTDQDTDSLVQYRVKGSNSAWITLGQVERTTAHSVKLFGLKPNTDYEYKLVSRNYLDNRVEYNEAAVPELKTTGFTISDTKSVTTTTGAEINWNTNLDADSAFVEYQMNKQPGDDPQGKTVGVNPSEIAQSPKVHKVVIQGLKSNRTYTFKIKSISRDGYVSESNFETFTTRSFDTGQFTLTPSSSNVAERNITATTAQIVWQTATPTTSWVDYSTQSGKYDNSAGDNELNTQHAVMIEGLIPGTKYFYRVRAKDSNDIEYTSQEYTFTAVLKPKISNFKVSEVKPYSFVIEWTTNVDTETLINLGTSATYGEKRGVPGLRKQHKLIVEGLTDNTEYHYQILAKDEMGNEVADTDKIVRTPLDTEGPQILNVKTDILPIGADEGSASVIVSWQTNKPASTMVEYDEGIIGGRYSMKSIEDKSLNLSHSVILKDLKPASSYHFKIISKDRRGNIGQSPDHTFVTPTKEKSILQLILKSLEETFSWTKNVGNFFGNVGKRATGK